MNELVALFNELKGALGGAAAVGISVAVYLWTQRGDRQLDSANTSANVSAIAHWRDVVARTDAQLKEMTERADKFAEERNAAWKIVAQLEGRIQELTRQVEQATQTIAELREQIQRMGA